MQLDKFCAGDETGNEKIKPMIITQIFKSIIIPFSFEIFFWHRGKLERGFFNLLYLEYRINIDGLCLFNFVDTGPLIERGDAGGGFVVPKNGVYFLYGIVSSRHTALKKFSVFTDVYRHIGWIIQVKNTVEERLILETTKISGKTR